MDLVKGVHPGLEEMADAMIVNSEEGITAYKDKQDILSRWKIDTRNKSREVLVSTPDRSTRQGMYGRQANPDRPGLNARDGEAGMHRQTPGPLRAYLVEQGYMD